MKICYVRQPAGIGDIFFTQKIARKLVDKGYKVIWPVKPDFLWIKDYIPGVTFTNVEDPYSPALSYSYNHYFWTSINVQKDGDTIYLPLQSADRHYPNESVMLAKYRFVGLDHSDWAEYFNFNRNKEREDKLYYDILGLRDNSEYVFVNKNYGSPPNYLVSTYLDGNKYEHHTVDMKFIDGITLFDWCKVLERAKEIYTVETSLNYIIEKLNTTDKLNMYSKWTPPDYKHIKMLFKKPWKYN